MQLVVNIIVLLYSVINTDLVCLIDKSDQDNKDDDVGVVFVAGRSLLRSGLGRGKHVSLSMTPAGPTHCIR